MRFFVLILLLTILAPGTAAQEADWPVVEGCIGDFNYPSIPPSRWDFDGTIVSVNDEGVRAIRTAEPQQYFVALTGAESFPQAGAFSPDGRWFAYPAVDGSETVLFIAAVDGEEDALLVPWPFAPDAPLSGLPRPLWNTSAVVQVQHLDGQWYAIDRAEGGEATPIEPPLPPPWGSAVAPGTVPALSPDGQFAAFIGIDALGNRGTVRYADLAAETIYDLCFRLTPSALPQMAWSPDSTTLAFTVDGFPVLLNVGTMQNVVLRYETGDVMAWLPPPPVFKEGRG